MVSDPNFPSSGGASSESSDFYKDYDVIRRAAIAAADAAGVDLRPETGGGGRFQELFREAQRHLALRRVFDEVENRQQPETAPPAPAQAFGLAIRPQTDRPLTPAEIDVVHERLRQHVKGFDAAHDDKHVNGELAQAASVYAEHAAKNARRSHDDGRAAPWRWPFEATWWKPEDRRADLIKAAALCIAEVERLDRLAAREAGYAVPDDLISISKTPNGEPGRGHSPVRVDVGAQDPDGNGPSVA